MDSKRTNCLQICRRIKNCFEVTAHPCDADLKRTFRMSKCQRLAIAFFVRSCVVLVSFGTSTCIPVDMQILSEQHCGYSVLACGHEISACGLLPRFITPKVRFNHE